MNSLMKLIVGTAMFALVIPAFAEDQGQGKGQGKGIERRIENQKKRIQKGLEKGKITQDQANALNQKVDAIATETQTAKGDGKLSKEERAKIQQELRDSSKEIYKEKHQGKEMPSKPAESGSGTTAPSGN